MPSFFRGLYSHIPPLTLCHLLFVPGSSPVYAGRSGRSVAPDIADPSIPGRVRAAGLPGSLVTDWYKCVRNVTVSSRERHAQRLYDRSLPGCWQSSGSQGGVSSLAVFFLV